MKRPFSILLVVVVLSAFTFAHDLYLVSGIEGAEGKVCARIGEHFPESSNALSPERVEFFRVRAAAGEVELAGTVEGNQFCAPYEGEKPVIAEIQVHPNFIKLPPEIFNQYIEAEGFREVIRRRRETGNTEKPGRELYSRYSKLLIGSGSRLFTQPLGHVLEIVPGQDPTSLKPGEVLTVQVLFRGRPLPDAQLGAAWAGAGLENHQFPVTARTDAEGRAQLKLSRRPGLWYVRLIHMEPAVGYDPEVEWRSYFSTLTFRTAAE